MSRNLTMNSASIALQPPPSGPPTRGKAHPTRVSRKPMLGAKRTAAERAISEAMQPEANGVKGPQDILATGGAAGGISRDASKTVRSQDETFAANDVGAPASTDWEKASALLQALQDQQQKAGQALFPANKPPRNILALFR